VYADELNTPLGRDRDRQDTKRPIRWARALAILFGLFGLATAGWALYTHNPIGAFLTSANPDLPNIIKPNRPDAAPVTTGALPSKPETKSTSEPPPGSKTITIIDGATGARKDVVVPQ